MREKIYDAFNMPEHDCADLVTAADEEARLLHSLEPLTPYEVDAMRSYDEEFLVRFTYNSAAIEGSTLSLADTALVLEGEFAPSGDKRLSEMFAARGIADGCAFSDKALADGIAMTEDLIRDIHERTALDCQPRTRGMYRLSSVYIGGSQTVTADPMSVRGLMSDLVFAYENSGDHPIVRAAAFHAMFENIHPFQDGNGRTGRIVLNHMLREAGYPPIAIKASLRSEYYAALEDWQVRGEPRHLIESVSRCVCDECAARRKGILDTRRAVASIDPAEMAEKARRSASSSTCADGAADRARHI